MGMIDRRALGCVLVLLASCSSSSDKAGSAPVPPLPTDAQTLAFTRAFHVPLAAAEIGDKRGIAVVDTGSPQVFVSPIVFPGSDAMDSADLTVASQSVAHVPIVSYTEPTGDPAIVPGAIVGGPVLFNRVVSLDYRDAAISFGMPTDVSGLSPEVALPFSLEGKPLQLGMGDATLPPSRIVVPVNIEGATYRMLVDTGASTVTLDQSAFDALTADGRSVRVSTDANGAPYDHTRAYTVSVSAASAQGVVVEHDQSSDDFITGVSREMGDTIHGVLGGAFLERFEVTIDYPNRELHLAPYEDESFVVDGSHTVGITIGNRVKGGYRIANVPHGTDAEAKRVLAGDAIVAIDGQAVDPLTLSQVLILLSGPVGSTRSVTFGVAENLANQTIDLRVDDLLPLP